MISTTVHVWFLYNTDFLIILSASTFSITPFMKGKSALSLMFLFRFFPSHYQNRANMTDDSDYIEAA